MLGMIKRLLNAFKQEKKVLHPGKYYLVKWTGEAVRRGAFKHPFAKEIQLFIDGEQADSPLPYSLAIIESLEKNQIPGVDVTGDKPEYPVIYETVPEALKEVRYARPE